MAGKNSVGVIEHDGTVGARNGQLWFKGPYNPDLVDQIRTVPGRKWDPATKTWWFPANTEARALVRAWRLDVRQDAQDLIDETARQARDAQEIKDDTAPAVPLRPMPINPGVVPYDHQVRAYNLGVTLPRVGYLMEMGTGKTLTALAVAARRYRDGEIRRVLVVAPLSVLAVWAREAQAMLDVPVDVRTLTGPVKKRVELLHTWRREKQDALQIAVVNYETTWRSGMFDALAEWDADLVIADESQRIKTPGAKQSKALHRLGDRAPYKMILTGTPITASPLDFWSQYRFLQKGIFQTSYYAFRSHYAVLEDVRIPGRSPFQKVIGYRNKKDLVARAHSIAYRVTKEEALDLPDTIDQTLHVTLEPKATGHYKQLTQEMLTELENGGVVTAPNILTRLLRLQQVTGGFLPDADGGDQVRVSSAKENELMELLQDRAGLDPWRGKTVVFCRFRAEIAGIREQLEKEGISYRELTGDTPGRDREQAVADFQDDPDVMVFLAQIQAAGVGLTLTAADVAVFYSTTFSYADYYQARARLHRVGQKQSVVYVHLVVPGTVDERVAQALAAKREIADDVVDNWRAYLEPGEAQKGGQGRKQ